MRGPGARGALRRAHRLATPKANRLTGWILEVAEGNRLSADDRLDIMDLIARYAYTLDSGDLDGYVNNFAPDGVLFEHQRAASRFVTTSRMLMREGRAGPLPNGDVAYRHFVGSADHRRRRRPRHRALVSAVGQHGLGAAGIGRRRVRRRVRQARRALVLPVACAPPALPGGSPGSPARGRTRQAAPHDHAPSSTARCSMFEARAREIVPPDALAFATGGAASEATLSAIARALQHLAIEQRVLMGVKNVDITASFLGMALPSPIIVCAHGRHVPLPSGGRRRDGARRHARRRHERRRRRWRLAWKDRARRPAGR